MSSFAPLTYWIPRGYLGPIVFYLYNKPYATPVLSSAAQAPFIDFYGDDLPLYIADKQNIFTQLNVIRGSETERKPFPPKQRKNNNNKKHL